VAGGHPDLRRQKMTIHAARLRPRNPKRGMGIRTYQSAVSGTTYKVGEHGQPSPIKLVKSQDELIELGEIEQFQLLTFGTMADLDAFIEKETTQQHRKGNFIQKPVIERAKRPRPVVEDSRIAKAKLDYDSDETGEEEEVDLNDEVGKEEVEPVAVNTGRKPKPAILDDDEDDAEADEEAEEAEADEEAEESEEITALREEVAEMEEKVAEAKRLKRKPGTIKKWEGRLEDAQAALEKSLG
jgi:hypothetical protein